MQPSPESFRFLLWEQVCARKCVSGNYTHTHTHTFFLFSKSRMHNYRDVYNAASRYAASLIAWRDKRRSQRRAAAAAQDPIYEYS